MKKLLLATAFLSLAFNILAQYIGEVLEYTPAPGQLINNSTWGSPNSAQSIVGGINGTLSLGSFGGYVVFGFEEAVENNSNNPFGVDFTIFGNPLPSWSEPAIVWVMKDDNNNGLADDTWYELAGSEYFFSNTVKDYQVTYTNPQQDIATDVPWEDNQGNTGCVFSNSYYTQEYYPIHDSFPQINNEEYTLSGTSISIATQTGTSKNINSEQLAFGYADNRTLGSAPYTIPDNPYTLEKENSGGDAFDINWAIDNNGNYVELDLIHFIKVQNAVLGNGEWLGEISSEIKGAVNVTPNTSISGETEMIVIKALPDTIYSSPFQIEVSAYNMGRKVDKTISWQASIHGVNVDSDNIMQYTTTGPLTLTASLNDSPHVVCEASCYLKNGCASIFSDNSETNLKVFPNPAKDILHAELETSNSYSITIYNALGTTLIKKDKHYFDEIIDISNLASGVYFLQAKNGKNIQTARFIKH